MNNCENKTINLNNNSGGLEINYWAIDLRCRNLLLKTGWKNKSAKEINSWEQIILESSSSEIYEEQKGSKGRDSVSVHEVCYLYSSQVTVREDLLERL